MTTYVCRSRASADVVRLAVTGALTGDAVDSLDATLRTALVAGRAFAVLFDRRAMTELTPCGRRALERFATTTVPRLEELCLAWADFYDEGRALSWAERHGPGDVGRPAALPYPHRVFISPSAAAAWLDGV